MTKIDWYILRKFIGTFVYSLMILLIISVVIDITEKVDDFMSNNLSLRTIVVDYYFGFIPHIAALLFPLFIFISVIFFTSRDGVPHGDHRHPYRRRELPSFHAPLCDRSFPLQGHPLDG